jgi:conjugal transfer pilus assembly protein TraV
MLIDQKKDTKIMTRTKHIKRYRQSILNILGASLLGSFLSGCSLHTNEEFDCPAGKGLGCQSVTEVKKKLNQGEIDIPETTMEAARRRGTNTMLMVPPVIGQTPVSLGTANSFGPATPIQIVDSSGLVIQRTPEQPLRVWIAPYQDQDGNLREASVVHTVIKNGSWQLSPGI